MRDFYPHPNSVQTVYWFPLKEREDDPFVVDFSRIPSVDLIFRGVRPVTPDDIDLLIEYLGAVRKALAGPDHD